MSKVDAGPLVAGIVSAMLSVHTLAGVSERVGEVLWTRLRLR